MFCENCGNKVGESEKFCNKCGATLAGKSKDKKPETLNTSLTKKKIKIVDNKPNEHKKIVGVVIGIVVAFLVIIPILSVFIIGAITAARKTSSETTHRSNAKSIQVGLESSYSKNQTYCGVGEIVCGNYSLSEIANKLSALSGVTLADTNCTGNTAGGGKAEISKDGYKIHVYNSDCGTELTDSLITMP